MTRIETIPADSRAYALICVSRARSARNARIAQIVRINRILAVSVVSL